jgi:hypothetical protein
MMTTSMRTWTFQRLTQIAAVAVVALLLMGSGAGTANAAPRQTASQAISNCQRQGGSAYYFEYWGVWAVGCSTITVNDAASDDASVTDNADTGKTDATHHKRHHTREHQQHVTDKHDRRHR